MLAFLKGGGSAGSAGPSASTEKPTPKKNRKENIPWVEKYRPKVVTDVVAQAEVVSVLEKCISGADLPNFLFYGPPGTGKTSTILAAARQLFGEMYRDRLLEINASDDRGIQVIRQKVQQFSERAVSSTRPDGKPCLPLKIIILDEADSMTHPAQAALRKIMESNTKTTRFCLICNYVSRIIDPITSRCAKFRFKPLKSELVFERLKLISDIESIQIDTKTLDAVVDTSGGDMRRAITTLQSCFKLKGKDSAISVADVLDISGIVPVEFVKDFLKTCMLGDLAPVEKLIDTAQRRAYSAAQLVEQLNEVIVASESLTDKQKAVIGQKLGVVSYRLHEGCSERLSLLEIALTIISQCS